MLVPDQQAVRQVHQDKVPQVVLAVAQQLAVVVQARWVVITFQLLLVQAEQAQLHRLRVRQLLAQAVAVAAAELQMPMA